jgi:hypothetical protein
MGVGGGPGQGGSMGVGGGPGQGGSMGVGGGPGQGGSMGVGGGPGQGSSMGVGGAGGSKTCGPATCAGCCDEATDLCRPGLDGVACGQSGVSCTNCEASGFACEGGACAGVKPPCGPDTCKGCCDGAGTCRLGTETDACGEGGLACQGCGAMGQGCVMGVCEGAPPACGAQSCGGCCDSSGQCLAGDAAAACGAQGAACATCKASESCFQPGGYCASLPQCSAFTCPSGCCDAKGICQQGSIDAQCGDKGQSCQDCSAQGKACAAQGFCYAGAHCGPDNCAGCCTLLGECKEGSDGAACGQFGGLCQNCAGKGEICDGFACATGETCPAPYGGCSPAALTPPPKKSTSCSAPELDVLAQACEGSGTQPGCGSSFGDLLGTNPDCYSCLLQFVGDGAYASCLAPYLSETCNHQLSCAADCSNSTCEGCSPIESMDCEKKAFSLKGACEPWLYGYYCAQAAIQGPAKFCDFSSYGNDVGLWIQAVGGHYCGGL